MAVLGGATVALVTVVVLSCMGRGTVASGESGRSTLSAATLEAVAARRVFFGHQSVGANIISAIPTVFAEAGVEGPGIVQTTSPSDASGAVIMHTLIGANRDPLGKMRDFESMIRGGVGDTVEVALMKLCFVDIDSRSDVVAVFDAYVDSMARLERDYPEVTFLHSTVPLTTKRGLMSWLRSGLGGDDHAGPADNVAREEYNALMRSKYGGSGRLFDLAGAEADPAGGQAAPHSWNGRPYYELQDAYASDSGHLNAYGGVVVAAELLATIGRSASSP